jgi:hypothetical protein
MVIEELRVIWIFGSIEQKKIIPGLQKPLLNLVFPFGNWRQRRAGGATAARQRRRFYQ